MGSRENGRLQQAVEGLVLDTANDLRYALRRLLTRPVFTIALVLTLGLSIGANIAIFTLVDALLVRALPYSHPERLVLISELSPLDLQSSPASFEAWKKDSSFLQDAAWYGTGRANLVGGSSPRRLRLVPVTANFFDVLGVLPRAGRFFLPDEEEVGHDNVTVISEKLWQTNFGGDSSAIGKTILLNARTYSIIGVAPATCNFPAGADVWTPTAYDEKALGAAAAVWSSILARLKPDVTVAQADSQQRAWIEPRLNQYPEGFKPNNSQPVVQSLKNRLVANLRLPTTLLFAAVALVLLIGCANVANLILADSAMREHEFAVRGAVGMRARRLARQLLTEQLLIGLIGGAVGLLVALWLLPYLRTFLPVDWPEFARLSIDFPVFAFALALSVFVAVLVAAAPSWRFTRRLGAMTLALGTRGTEARATKRWREVLVGVETCLAMVLLVAAALCVRTLRNLTQVDLGFKPAGVIAVSLTRTAANAEGRGAATTFYPAALERLRAIPGVEAAGGVDSLPARAEYTVVDRVGSALDESGSDSLWANWAVAAPDYFKAMGIPIVAGRDFSDFDDKSHEPVAIISRLLADKLWPGQNPLGQQLSSEMAKGKLRVVGVTEPVRYMGAESRPMPELYRPIGQSSPQGEFNFVIHASSESAAMTESIKSAIRSVDPDQPFEISALKTYVDRKLQSEKGTAAGLGLLSSLGLVLAIVGVYGLVSYSVTARKREFGIRMAFGELSGGVFVRSLSSALRAVLPGVALGILGSLAAARFLKSLLFGVKASDPLTITLVAIALILAATLAGAVAARRTTRLDPVAILREQ